MAFISSNFLPQQRHFISLENMVRRVRKKQVRRRKRRCQGGGFLNRYDFAYAGRDTVNTAMKNVERIAPGLMKQFSSKVNNVAQQRIQ